jgi:hypothetical protein
MKFSALHFGIALPVKCKISKKMWISPKIVDKYEKSMKNEQKEKTHFGFPLPLQYHSFRNCTTNISDFRYRQFGFPLPVKVA